MEGKNVWENSSGSEEARKQAEAPFVEKADSLRASGQDPVDVEVAGKGVGDLVENNYNLRQEKIKEAAFQLFKELGDSKGLKGEAEMLLENDYDRARADEIVAAFKELLPDSLKDAIEVGIVEDGSGNKKIKVSDKPI